MRINYFGKTVLIPTIVKEGRFQYLYGGPLPDLREGTILDLIVPEDNVMDKVFLGVLENSRDFLLLQKDTSILAAVASSRIPENLKNWTIPMSKLSLNRDPITASLFDGNVFVEIKLLEALYIQLKGTKRGRLRQVKCEIPDLKLAATSLNHAYRIISDMFEPQRISHAGNVFQKILYLDSEGRWKLLGDLRMKFEAQYEANLKHSY